MLTALRRKNAALPTIWCSILLLFLYQQNSWIDETIASQQGQQANITSTLVPSAPALSKTKYGRILSTTIFSLSQQASDSDLTIAALGILTSSDGLKAVVKFSANKTAVLLSVGERYENWEMVSLESDHIILKGSDGTFRVNFASTIKNKQIITHGEYHDVDKMVREVEEIIDGSNSNL